MMNNRVNIYINVKNRRKIKRKARKLGMSVSKLLVSGALEYGGKLNER